MPKVLISDQMDPQAAEIFRARGVEVDEKTGLSRDELKSIIGDYDGLAIRSATKVTADVLEAAANLKVVGRAAIFPPPTLPLRRGSGRRTASWGSNSRPRRSA
jgi:D-3-phosphoglycerate dehydrogenase